MTMTIQPATMLVMVKMTRPWPLSLQGALFKRRFV